MLSPNYTDANNKLDEQIQKLRKCKEDMLSMFEDLDNLGIGIGKSKLEYSYDNYEDERSSNSSEHTCLECLRHKFDPSDSDSDESDYELNNNNNNYSDDDETSNYSSKKRNYSPARMKFSLKIPKNNRSTEFYNPSFNTSFPNSVLNTNNNRPLTSMSFQTPNKNSNFDFQDEFYSAISKHKKNNSQRPSRSLMSSNLSQSTSSLNRTSSTQNKINPKFSTPWRATGKFRADSAKFLSSQDLTKSTESLAKSNKKPPISKDVGNGWKTVLGKPKSNYRVYAQPEKDKEPIKTVTVKRKIIIDEKDIGGGWKTILGKPKEDNKLLVRAEVEKDPIKNVTVKRKVFVDKKDVGKGWKPAIGKSNEDLKIYEVKKPDTNVSEQEKIVKKKFIDEKDVGKGWKPAGKPKEDKFIKTEVDPNIRESTDALPKKVEKQVNIDTKKGWKPAGKPKEDLKIYSKPPIPNDTNKSSSSSLKKEVLKEKSNTKNFIISNKKTQSHPNTWAEDALMKTSKEAKNLIRKDSNENSNKNKSNDRMMTSTPNMSKNFDENELEESLIQNDNNLDKVINNGKNDKIDKSLNNSQIIKASDQKEEKVESKQEDLNEKIASESEDESSVIADNEANNKANENKEESKEKSIKSEDLDEDPLKTKNNNSIFKRVDTKDEDFDVKSPSESNKENNNNEQNSEKKDEITNKENEDEEEDLDEKERQFWNMKDSDDE